MIKLHKCVLCILISLHTISLPATEVVSNGKLIIPADKTLWDIKPNELSPELFELWDYGDNSDLFYSASLTKKELTFLGMDFPEAKFSFNYGNLKQIRICIYNQRDQKTIPSQFFNQLYSEIKLRVLAWCGSDPLYQKNLDGSLISSWKIYGGKIELLAQSTCNSVHNIQLIVTSDDKNTGIAEYTKLIRNRCNVYLTITPSHQVKSGYCVPASAEIVFRSLGLDCNVFSIAYLAKSTTNSGTNDSQTAIIWEKLAKKVGMKFKLMFNMQNLDQFARMVDQYNSFYKKRHKKSVELCFINKNGLKICDMTQTFSNFNYELYKRFKTHYQTDDMELFFSKICDSIDSGIPVGWSCMNGFETNSVKELTGHMCVINGYNKATKEIIYTNPSGLKGRNHHISLEDAWTKNLGIYLLIK